jgi:hypothetical protein
VKRGLAGDANGLDEICAFFLRSKGAALHLLGRCVARQYALAMNGKGVLDNLIEITKMWARKSWGKRNLNGAFMSRSCSPAHYPIISL